MNKYFDERQMADINTAIKEAELNTSSEIKVHIEDMVEGDVIERANYIFRNLGINKTKERNGVLFYLAMRSKKFAIIADDGIKTKISANFWDGIKQTMMNNINNDNFTESLSAGIILAGEQLKKEFPHVIGSENQLDDGISFGETLV